jgi:hypothetical protein
VCFISCERAGKLAAGLARDAPIYAHGYSDFIPGDRLDEGIIALILLTQC